MAHVGSHEHKVFNEPFKVEPEVELWDTPGNYRRYPHPENLPDKIEVWRIHKPGKSYGGVVVRGYDFGESGDAEVLAPGFNTAKEYGAVAVGRHANFLQWGYAGSPSKMTEAGRKFFINCIAYISAFDGKTPLVRPKSAHRTNAVWYASLIKKVKDKGFFDSTFSAELMEEYKDNPDALVKYYWDNFELIYKDKVFRIDTELKSLGIGSNWSMSTLEKLIALRSDQTSGDTAQKLLTRYTEQSFTGATQWRRWFESNKGRIYFSDIGGYKFLVVPPGKLDK